MGVLVWKSHWQVKDLQVSDTSLSSFEFCDCDVCVCWVETREKVCRAGCRRTTEAGAGSSQSWGLSVVDGRLGFCKGHLPGAPPGGARSEDPDGRTGGCIDRCPFSIPCLWETCSDSPAFLEAWVFPKGLLLLLLSHFSRVQLCATPETAAPQAPPSLGFSRQEHWSGLPFPSPVRESEKSK